LAVKPKAETINEGVRIVDFPFAKIFGIFILKSHVPVHYDAPFLVNNA